MWVVTFAHLYLDSAGHRLFACFGASLMLTATFGAKMVWEDN